MAILTAIDTRLALRRADDVISQRRARLRANKLANAEIVGQLNGIPQEFSDLLDTINAPGYGATELEVENQALLQTIIDEYGPLRDAANSQVAWVAANITEY